MLDKKYSGLVLCVILLSDDTLIFGTNNNKFFIIFRYIAYLLIICLTLFFRGSTKISKNIFNSLSVFFILSGLVVLSSLYNSDFMTGNFLMLLTLLTSIAIISLVNFSDFQRYFVNLMYFFSISSLIVYLVNIFQPGLISVFPVVTNFGEVSFRTVFLSNVFLEGNKFRNPGIFREPGVFAIYLNLALLFILFFNKKPSLKVLIVLILALFSTLSTAGIIVFFFLASFYFFKERSFKIFFLSIAFYLIISIVFLFFPTVYEVVFSKLNSSDKDFVSSLARLASFLTPIEIIKESPIIGVGLTNFVLYYEKFSLQLVGFTMKADSTSTNTFLNTIAIFGVIFGGIIIKGYYNFCRLINENYSLVLLLLLFIMFSSQDLRYSLLYFVLFSYGSANYSLK